MTIYNIIALCFSAVSVSVAIVGFIYNAIRNNNIASRQLAEEIAEIKSSSVENGIKLSQVCATTNETRCDLKSMDTKISNLSERVAIVESQQKLMQAEITSFKKED